MSEWCQLQHGDSGLTEACRHSELSLAQAEEKVKWIYGCFIAYNFTNSIEVLIYILCNLFCTAFVISSAARSQEGMPPSWEFSSS